MSYIAIIESISSGAMYVNDAKKIGYEPIIIFPPIMDKKRDEYRRTWADKFKNVITLFPKNLEALLVDLEKYDIKCVVPGTSFGVEWADIIANKLNLNGNDPTTTYCRNTKLGMHDTLKESGLRYIKSKRITCDTDIIDFWNNNNLKKAVIKYSYSWGSFGFKVCSSLDEALNHYYYLYNNPNHFGEKHSMVIIQEYIEGEEYVVNTISRDGKHVISDIWKYNKIKTDDGTVLYDSTELITTEVGLTNLIQYDYSVLTALGIRYGFCHTEIMVDDKGPVLIETNPRPMGFNMNPEYMDELLGHHMSDISLMSYMDEAGFNRFYNKKYSPFKYGIIKSVIVSKETDIDLGPFLSISKKLNSYRYHSGAEPGRHHYRKTIDLGTSPLSLKLCNDNLDVLRHESEFISELEKYYFG